MSNQDLLKKALFVPCRSKEDLHRWIKVYLGLDIPDCTVAEESNSNPMEVIWEVYSKCINNDVSDITRLMAYASRDSFKTLSAAVLETLMILHLDRPVVHLSAILQQSKKSQEYVKSYFNRPLIRDYKVKENERQIEYVRYYNAVTGDSITEKEWEALPTGQGLYEKKQTYIQIIVATLQSTNSAHVPFLCVDGESEVQVEVYGSNRKRRSRKIKDVFLALKGQNPSGRRGKPQPDTIVPKKEIKVLSADANGNLSMQRITKAKMSFADCIRLDLSDGKSITCTPSHEIFTLKSGYIKASELKIGDCLVSIDRAKSPQIVKISQVGQRAVYDIAVENNNNFFANGVLVHNCVDEIDVIANPKAYEEAKFIPAPWGNKLPVTFLTSTRKFSYGLVQKELDEADETHLAVRHWNIIDVTQPCLPERHQPEKPKEKLWVYDEEIRHATDAEYQNLDPEIQKDFVQHEGYAGCAKCPLFAACKGQLATKQFCKSKLLKPIEHTINLFRSASIGSANAQLLCRKPDTSGLIYPYLDKIGHMKTAAEIMALVSTDATNIKTKAELISWFLSNGASFYSGMDFGFTHDFAVVTGAVWGNYLFVLDCIGIANLELDDKIQACEKLRYINPVIFGDPESPSDIETFRKKGKFRMRKWVKGPGSVKSGIETVRSKLRPAIGKPTMFFLKDDLGVAALVEQLSKYHFKLDAAGNVTDEPAKENDDRADACRYLVMNVFNNKGKIIASFEGTNAIGKTVHLTEEQARNSEMLDIVRNYLDNTSETTATEEDEPKEKKSKFVFDI